MNNYKLTIQYDGSRFHGWQMQNNASSIQQQITDAVKILIKEDVNIIGAGRTDAGVHALGQAANFRCNTVLNIRKFVHSLNGILPSDISVTKCEPVHEDFHARFDALSRSYRYIVYSAKNPFLIRKAFFYPQLPDNKKLNGLCCPLLGRKDFFAFCKEAPANGNTDCNIFKAHWRQTGSITIFLIEADRFLHGMVRLLAGTMLYAERNNLNEEWIAEILRKKEKSRFAVPSCGLYLENVKYPRITSQSI